MTTTRKVDVGLTPDSIRAMVRQALADVQAEHSTPSLSVSSGRSVVVGGLPTKAADGWHVGNGLKEIALALKEKKHQSGSNPNNDTMLWNGESVNAKGHRVTFFLRVTECDVRGEPKAPKAVKAEVDPIDA
jgi:hypothetical protein